MANNVYLQLDWKTAQFYEHSAEEKIGFEEHTNTNGAVSYRRYHKDGVTGTYRGSEVRDSQIGPRLQSTWQVADTFYKAQLPMYSPGQEFTEFAESFIRILPNLVVGKVYRMYPYHIEKSPENKYDKRGISIKEGSKDGEKVPPLLSYAADAPDEVRIPRLEWKERLGKNQVTASSKEAKVDFLASWLERCLQTTENTPTPQQAAPPSTTPVGEDMTFPTSNTPPPTGEDSDLPF